MEEDEGRGLAVGVATGVVLPNTRLAVDSFKVRGASAYFLSHFHAGTRPQDWDANMCDFVLLTREHARP
jgi:hypothetical protein